MSAADLTTTALNIAWYAVVIGVVLVFGARPAVLDWRGRRRKERQRRELQHHLDSLRELEERTVEDLRKEER
jgi:hypothetical protein